MQVNKLFMLILCLALILSSCAKSPMAETQPMASSTADSTHSVDFPTRLSNENTTIGDYGTIENDGYENFNVFVDYDWAVSSEYFICYSNPENLENRYYAENRYGISDADGNIIIKPQFGFIRPAAKDRFIVANGTKTEYGDFNGSEYAVINGNGDIIIPFATGIESMIDYYDGLESTYFCVCTDREKYYLADNYGNKVYDILFTSFRVAHPVMYYADRTHLGVSDGKVYYFDLNLDIVKIIDENPVVGEIIFSVNDTEYYETVCFKNNNYCYGVIDNTTGKEVVPCEYEEVTVFAQNRILATETRGIDNTEWKFVIYDLEGNIVCPSGEYCNIELFEWSNDNLYQPIGIASAPNLDGDRIYGQQFEWLIDKNGAKISDKYYNIYYNHGGEMVGYFTADRGDRVFWLDKNGNVVGTIGE